MVDTLQQGLLDRRPEGFGQAPRPGRRAHLVADHGQGVALTHQAQHGLHEVAAKTGVDPARAHNQGARMRALHGALAGQLAAPVGAQRARGGVRQVGVAGVPGEYEVGGHVNQRGAGTGAGRGEVARSVGVDGQGQRLFFLGPVYRGIGSGIQHHIGTLLGKYAAHRLGVGNVQPAVIQRHDTQPRRCRGLQFAAQLARSAGDQGRRCHARACIQAASSANTCSCSGSLKISW